MERNRPSKGHSLTRDGRERDLSGHGKESTEQLGTHILEATERGSGQDTEKNGPIEGHSQPGDGRAEGETCQNMERNRPSKGHSHPGDGRGRDLSGHGKKLTERGVLTNWKRQRGEFVRTREKIDRARVLTNWRRRERDLSGHGKN